MRAMSEDAMDGDELRAWCLEMPGAVETFPFNPETSVFKIGEKGKLFALSALDGDPLKVSLKADPEIVVSMQRSYEAVGPGYHLNKRHWVTITVGGDLPDARIRDLVEDSYDLVKPKR
jgi:predicted DNA-binding protein (MmcQ/YjbR family)